MLQDDAATCMHVMNEAFSECDADMPNTKDFMHLTRNALKSVSRKI